MIQIKIAGLIILLLGLMMGNYSLSVYILGRLLVMAGLVMIYAANVITGTDRKKRAGLILFIPVYLVTMALCWFLPLSIDRLICLTVVYGFILIFGEPVSPKARQKRLIRLGISYAAIVFSFILSPGMRSLIILAAVIFAVYEVMQKMDAPMQMAAEGHRDRRLADGSQAEEDPQDPWVKLRVFLFGHTMDRKAKNAEGKEFAEWTRNGGEEGNLSE